MVIISSWGKRDRERDNGQNIKAPAGFGFVSGTVPSSGSFWQHRRKGPWHVTKWAGQQPVSGNMEAVVSDVVSPEDLLVRFCPFMFFCLPDFYMDIYARHLYVVMSVFSLSCARTWRINAVSEDIWWRHIAAEILMTTLMINNWTPRNDCAQSLSLYTLMYLGCIWFILSVVDDTNHVSWQISASFIKTI